MAATSPSIRPRRIPAPSLAAYIILVALGLFFLLPFAWLLLSSINPAASFSVEIPRNATLNNFHTVLTDGLVRDPFKNSFIIAISAMLLTIALAGLAAYPLSRYAFRFKTLLMYVILFASGLPILALVTPLYAMYVKFNLVDTYWGVILFMVASSLPFNIWLMKNFLDSVPVEMEEAAWVDGASILSAFWHIVLPLAAPGVAVVGVFSFLGAWTNFFVPFIIFQSPEHMPASVNIYSFFGAYGEVNYGQLAAYAILYALPTIVLYFIVSRFLVKGMLMGGLKG
jgi:multiple sugar transport system permease protein